MNKRLHRCYLIPLLSCICWLGCQHNTNSRFTIVATTSLLGDAVKNIVQDHATVITLMGPGVDPHAYHATQKDAKQLFNACLLYTSPSPRD